MAPLATTSYAKCVETNEKLVGAERFELSTPSPPDWCANRAALRSDATRAGYSYGFSASSARRSSRHHPGKRTVGTGTDASATAPYTTAPSGSSVNHDPPR